MKRLFPYLLFFLGFLFVPHISFASETSPLVLSEILIGEEKASDAHEFVELYNSSSASIDLSGFRLRYKNSNGTENSLALLKSGSCIPPHGFFLWANSKGKYASQADVTTSTGLTENYTVLLFAPETSGGALLDSISWKDTKTLPFPPITHSWSRDLDTLNWLPEATSPTPIKSTPCPAPEPPLPPVPVVTHVRINEILPNPANKEEEFIELYNDSGTQADLSTFSLHDASQSGEYIFPAGTLITPHGYLVFLGSVSKIALNNSNETLSLFDNTHTLIDSMSYKTGREGVSINFTESGWRGGAPTPGTLNQPNALPETKEKVPKKGYGDMPVLFDARGHDSDGGTLKYTWDFGDGHKSYKEETSHTYEHNGIYQVTLTTSDGSDDTIEAFTLTIESFPKLDIRITALSPNPSGKDSENEWILIENREKESIDLKGFSIATGWDNLINHPVRESFVIKPHKEATLTRKFSAFTLPNKKGRIELRGPNGKVLQEIEYKEKNSIDEDMVYRKEKGKRWEWHQEKKIPSSQEEAKEATIDTSSNENIPEVIPEEKSIDPQVASIQKIDQEAVRREFYRLLHHHNWVDVSETHSLSVSSSLTAPSFSFQTLLSTANGVLNTWQNKK